MKDNNIINMDFSKYDTEYYIIFRTPKNKIKQIKNVHKILLKRVSPDAVELKVINDKNKTYIYHYVNEFITLLDDLEVGINS